MEQPPLKIKFVQAKIHHYANACEQCQYLPTTANLKGASRIQNTRMLKPLRLRRQKRKTVTPNGKCAVHLSHQLKVPDHTTSGVKQIHCRDSKYLRLTLCTCSRRHMTYLRQSQKVFVVAEMELNSSDQFSDRYSRYNGILIHLFHFVPFQRSTGFCDHPNFIWLRLLAYLYLLPYPTVGSGTPVKIRTHAYSSTRAFHSVIRLMKHLSSGRV